ncbi:polysaccharide pyruvyl transferase family protein [Arthrobacter psychrochitiniphilus]|uniref:polysaccharide pyruvyl transferase family protein n=1 Tax=Arthrobacter psychrochitiniphilus TaxID=291045 RepID=UPI003F7BD776
MGERLLVGEEHKSSSRRLRERSAEMRALILHAYSASNLGDGLLVRETIELVKESVGADVQLTVLASHPETFADLPVTVLNSAPTKLGFSWKYLSALWNIGSYDVVVAVGGGYLRAGTRIEAVKSGIIHGPQLLAAAFGTRRAIYLSQSVGPARFGTKFLLTSLLSRQHAVWLRDDRSLEQFPLANTERVPDLAILGMKRTLLPFDDAKKTILSVRFIRGVLTKPILALRELLGDIDSYVQSSVASNNDVPAVSALNPHTVLSVKELMDKPESARVVVAVRLHAALMAIAAGHFVIHLAYERKGFGAFQDLGIPEFVFNVNDFDANAVASLVRRLREESGLRTDYHQRIIATRNSSDAHRSGILAVIAGSISPDSGA